MATYLIDYENVSKDGLNGVTRLTEEDRVIIFYSERADRMTFGLHRRLNETKAVIEYKKVEVGGRNALDFQLATYLGFLMAKNPGEEYCVVSNDRGYEYLVGFWRKPLYNVTLTRAIASSPQAEERRQARRNAQRQEAERSGKQVETNAAEENQAVIAVEKQLLMTVPDAKERQIELVRETPSAMVKVEQKPVVTVLPIDNGDLEEPETPDTAEEPAEKSVSDAKPAMDSVFANDEKDSSVNTVKPAEEEKSAPAVAEEKAVAQSPNARGTQGVWFGNWKPKKAAEETVPAGGNADTAGEADGKTPEDEVSAVPVSDEQAEEVAPKADKNAGEPVEQAEETAASVEEAAPAEPEKTASPRSGRSSRGGRKTPRRPERRTAQDSAGDAKKTESGKAKEPDDDAEKDPDRSSADAKNSRRNSRTRKKTGGRERKKVIPGLADVKSLLSGSSLQEPDLEEIAGYVEKYKTKQGVNNALVRKFGNQKGGEVYQGIKSLLKDKKGREASRKTQPEN